MNLSDIADGKHWKIRTYELIHQLVLRNKRFGSLPSCDLIIVSHRKDFHKIDAVIKAVIAHSVNRIERIYIIGSCRQPTKVSSVAYEYIYEQDMLSRKVFEELKTCCPRPGWIIQQLLKLKGNILSNKYLVIDADTILIRPHVFFLKQSTVLRIAYESAGIYRDAEQMLGLNNAWNHVSFVAHMMPFEGSVVKELRYYVEKKIGKEFETSMIEIARETGWLLSEYNLYARFLITHNPNSFTIHPWLNKSLTNYPREFELRQLQRRYPFRNSLSFHEIYHT